MKTTWNKLFKDTSKDFSITNWFLKRYTFNQLVTTHKDGKRTFYLNGKRISRIKLFFKTLLLR